jgi:hypothetical protein
MSDPSEAAAAISAARDRLVAFVDRCPPERWSDAPLGDGDPRSVAVIVDHVADSYVYLGGWMRSLLDGKEIEVSGDIVDALNAEHAHTVAGIGRGLVREHLVAQGDEFVALVEGVDLHRWSAGDGAVSRFAEIGARHADVHRAELEAALGMDSPPLP